MTATRDQDTVAREQNDSFVLEARGLRKSFFGVEVLHGVDLVARGGRVLALLGENGAGKSTAVKILAGDYQRDAGTVFVNGEEVNIDDPRDAEAVGIRVIFQEFLDAPELSVAENISLGHLEGRFGVVNWRAVRRRAERTLEDFGVDLDVKSPVGELGVAQRQIVEIARALALEARVLIFDEPTSALAAEEVDSLFRFIRRLKQRGVAIIYITHRLDEVREIGDDVTVFRDGDVVASGAVDDFPAERIIEAMVGRELEETMSELAETDETESEARPLLVSKGASLEGAFHDIDLEVRSGEIVSLFGRLGCGALEFAEAVFGLRPLTRGELAIGGVRGQPGSPAEAIGRGVGFVPVDRKTEALLPGLTVGENISVASWDKLKVGPILPPAASVQTYRRWQETLNIQAAEGAGQAIETLSGGNQQKVVLGRWLEKEAQLLILAEPTRGVDVGARAEIYRVLTELAGRGIAILVVSSDIEEVLRISTRVVVLTGGTLVRRFTGDEINQHAVAEAAALRDVEAAG